LLRSGLNRLDIVLIHDCDVWTHGVEDSKKHFRTAMDGACLALDKLRREKIVKAIGFGSNEADTRVRFAKAGDFDVAMMAGRYTPLVQRRRRKSLQAPSGAPTPPPGQAEGRL
jgi:D-threo-aldose 1-dehydrogenase